jgi:hypothetical protein
MEKSPSSETHNRSVKKFSAFMEPEGSLLCSQETSAGPYPHLERTSPHLSTIFT